MSICTIQKEKFNNLHILLCKYITYHDLLTTRQNILTNLNFFLSCYFSWGQYENEVTFSLI